MRASIIPAVSLFIAIFAVLQVSYGASLEADIVIVGAGTAGSALAGRLCASLPHLQIVLLERGAVRSPRSEFLVRSPRLWELNLGTSEVSEAFLSEPTPGLNNRRERCITGRTLGGSSSINGMQFSFPLGNTISSWRIAGLNLRKARRFYLRAFKTIGFAPVSAASRLTYSDEYLHATVCTGIPRDNSLFNNRYRNGVQKTRSAIDKRGSRVDAYTAYVAPVIGGKCKNNLRVITGATVTRLLLRGRHVQGVEYLTSIDKARASKKTLIARKEVIVSAGPYGSPKLLQLSGIGPRAALKKVGVPLVKDLPVGVKTQGRAITLLSSKYTGVPLSPANNGSVVFSERTRRDWQAGRPNALSVPSGPVIGILSRIGYFASLIVPVASPIAGLDERIIRTVCLGNPQSFGSIKLASLNPLAPPKVDLNLLNDKADVRRLVACTRHALRIHNSFPQEFGMVTNLTARDINESFVRNNALFALHFVGGCAVGSVVTSDLRVRGIRGLRVIDSSVFRSIPKSSGPLSSVYMLAEFMADKLQRLYSK